MEKVEITNDTNNTQIQPLIRVLYISPIANPFSISRYRYYNLTQEDEIFLVMGDNDEVFEYTKETIQEYYRLEIGTWEEYFKSDITEEIIDEYTTIEEMAIEKNSKKN